MPIEWLNVLIEIQMTILHQFEVEQILKTTAATKAYRD